MVYVDAVVPNHCILRDHCVLQDLFWWRCLLQIVSGWNLPFTVVSLATEIAEGL